MATFATPGVFIEEQTGPGVIAGVGTSTAGFIGPALRGPIGEPRRVSSFDQFLRLYAASDPDTGAFQPHITSPRLFYMGHAVRGFFENGGSQAFIVRIGTAQPKRWQVVNRAGTPDVVFRLEALAEGAQGNSITVNLSEASATGTGVVAAQGVSRVNVDENDRTVVEVAEPEKFRVGDYVTKAGAPADNGRARIKEINEKKLKLDNVIAGLQDGEELRIANFDRSFPTLRLISTAGLFPGTVVKITGKKPDASNEEDWAVVESVSAAKFVTFASSPPSTKIFGMSATPPKLDSQEFNLSLNNGAESFANLSIHPLHPRNVLSTVDSKLVRVLPPIALPTGSGINAHLVSPNPTSTNGVNDDPGSLDVSHFEGGLAALNTIDDVNLVCIPDAAAHGSRELIQRKLIDACVKIKDRFAILDSRPGSPPSGPNSVEEQRSKVESVNGFAGLYYPWLEVPDPASRETPPRTLFIPPCGHIAGVFARTDSERGVHKAPANTDVRGILGLERLLSDDDQGPLNLAGVNVLRIFPGSSTVIIWGARTTVNTAITDWRYVPVRRLLLFIEESIEEGIRFAVFEPNAPPLWKALKRTISQFLTRVWRDGGLFGDTPDQAFRVRIDEGLNPPDVRALGRLFIEIRVAPVRPAEFIVVRIGLFDGGAEVQET